jgi:hypothetical protein
MISDSVFALTRLRGGGQPAVRVPAAGEGAATTGLLRRRAAQNCWVRKGSAFTGEIRLILPLVLVLCIVVSRLSGFGLAGSI